MAPDYEKFSILLNDNGVIDPPAYLHGLLTGLHCGGEKPPRTVLQAGSLLLDGHEPGKILEESLHLLDNEVRAGLQSETFDFQPLLPEDDEDISQRLFALARFCEGFALGFGSAWGGGDVSLPDETREVLTDFAAIADVDDSLDEGENQEYDLMEVIEYVRMAVNAVFMSRAGKTSGNSQQDKPEPNLH